MIYEEYINSDLWKQLRQKVLDRDEFCQTCMNTSSLEVHHRKYPDKWEEDNENNLITLCRECHFAITNLLRRRKHKKSRIIIKDCQNNNLRRESNEKLKTKINWSESTNLTQRTISRPNISNYKRDQENLIEEIEDGIRF